MTRVGGEPLLAPASRAEWRAWLAAHHRSAPAVWVAIEKSGASTPSLSIDDAQEEALCFGWIDVKGQRVGTRFAMRFTPRRPRSAWSIVNIRRVERLAAAGRMTPAGIEAVEQAQRNGEWALGLASADTDTLPPALHAALRRKKGALAAWRSLTASRRRQVLRSVLAATTQETQQRRIRAAVDSL